MTTNEDFEEIYLERSRYLLSTDDALEQIFEYRHTMHTIRTSQNITSGLGQKSDNRAETGLAIA